jgi:hypothetical protein
LVKKRILATAAILAAFLGCTAGVGAVTAVSQCRFDTPWTPAQVTAARDGAWNHLDRTGLAPVDSVLNLIAARVAGNPSAIAAVESTAANVKLNPQTYANRDCTLREPALRARLSEDFASVPGVSLNEVWPPVRRSQR